MQGRTEAPQGLAWESALQQELIHLLAGSFVGSDPGLEIDDYHTAPQRADRPSKEADRQEVTVMRDMLE